jgi:phosphoribosylpyrophosphate synthetase
VHLVDDMDMIDTGGTIAKGAQPWARWEQA